MEINMASRTMVANNYENATTILSDTDASSSVENLNNPESSITKGGHSDTTTTDTGSRIVTTAGTSIGNAVGGGDGGGTLGSIRVLHGGVAGRGYSHGTRTKSNEGGGGNRNHGDRGDRGVDDDDDTDDDNVNHELTDPSLAFNFMMEHRIFLRAALDLLTERDRHALELGMMDPVILKSGPLKKASHLMNGVWKVKYVEVRRGMFSYYENAVTQSKDSQGEAELLRKNIPLEASTVTCRAVKLHQKALALTPTGAIFELSFDGGSTKRLWMANNREERYVWIQSINNAMVGGSVTRGFDASLIDHSGYVRNVNGKSPFKTDLRLYLKTQNNIRNARTKQDYLLALKDLLKKSLQIPIKWIEKQSGESSGTNESDKAFQEETVAMSIEQVWRDLQRDSVCIDDELYKGDALHGPERIFGALTKRILKVAGRASGKFSGSDLRESQALVYARDILIAGNRTRSAGDSYYCVNTLCSNSDLVVVVPAGTAVLPISFQVSEDNSNEAFQSRFIDKSGWIKTRNSLQLRWTKLFCVLSEGTLSYYTGALPRPHGLRGQRHMKVSTISITRKPARDNSNNNVPSGGGGGMGVTNNDHFVLKISSEDSTTKDRLFLFESEDRLLDWVYALECVTKSNINNSNATTSNSGINNGVSNTTKKIRRRLSGNNKDNILTNTTSNATGSTEDATQASVSVNNSNPNSTMVEILNSAEQATRDHAEKLGLDGETLDSRLALCARRATSAVCITVTASTDYKICKVDPEGDDSFDTWGMITAHFLQVFRVTGGPNGRIMRGEETVRVVVTKCAETDTMIQQQNQPQQQQQGQPTHGDSSAENKTTALVTTTTAFGGTPLGGLSALVPASPATIRGRMNRRLFRNFGSVDDLDVNVGSPSDGAATTANPTATVSNSNSNNNNTDGSNTIPQ